MKIKTIFAASLLATGVAFADTAAVDAECVIGVLPVALAANQQEIILNIPWIEAGRSSGGVAVANLVKTAGLAVNDSLLWYDTSTSKYEGWHIESINGTNQWVASASVLPTGISTVVVGATALNRGQAILLSRASVASTTIYIVGGTTDVTASPLEMAAGTAQNPVFTLFAPPTVSATGINSLTWDGTIDPNDYIVLADGTQVKYDTSEEEWISYSYDEYGRLVSNKDPEIPVGTGAWYVSKGGSPTVTW